MKVLVGGARCHKGGRFLAPPLHVLDDLHDAGHDPDDDA